MRCEMLDKREIKSIRTIDNRMYTVEIPSIERIEPYINKTEYLLKEDITWFNIFNYKGEMIHSINAFYVVGINYFVAGEK